MQLDEGFWMRWSDDWGSSFTGGRVVVPVRRFQQLILNFLKYHSAQGAPSLVNNAIIDGGVAPLTMLPTIVKCIIKF